MKRKEALEIAIEAVNNLDISEETKSAVIHHLDICMGRLPQIRWDETSIKEYCDKVYNETGRLTCKDFNHAGQPYRKVFNRVFGMTFSKYRDIHYPPQNGMSQYSPYSGKSRKEWTQIFVEEYKRIQPKSMEEYDRQRLQKTPSWITIARINGVNKWSELLGILGLGVESKISTLVISSISQSEIELLKLQKGKSS